MAIMMNAICHMHRPPAKHTKLSIFLSDPIIPKGRGPPDLPQRSKESKCLATLSFRAHFAWGAAPHAKGSARRPGLSN